MNYDSEILAPNASDWLEISLSNATVCKKAWLYILSTSGFILHLIWYLQDINYSSVVDIMTAQ